MAEAGSSRLGRDLKKLREERKLTLGAVESLSVGLGERIAKTYLFRVERGKTYPTLPRLRILARIYRVRLSRLVETLENAVEEQELATDVGVDIARASFEELRKLGIAAERGGEFNKATLLYRAAWRRAEEEEGNPEEKKVRVAKARVDLAIALRNAGHLELAREEAEAALELTPRDGDLFDIIRLNLALVYGRLGHSALAREILDGLLARSGSLEVEVHAGASEAMGTILLPLDPRKAAQHYRSALMLARRMKNDYQVCGLLHNIGVAEVGCRNFTRALRRLHEGYELARKRQFSYLLAMIKSEIGKIHYLKGERELSRLSFRQANDIARRGDFYEPLFVNHYYLREMAREESNASEERIMESSLKFFATRFEGPCEELDMYRREPR